MLDVLEIPRDVASANQDFFSAEEAKSLFDATAQRYLRISGDDFLLHWDAGDYVGAEGEESNVMRVAALLPMVRSVSARQNSV